MFQWFKRKKAGAGDCGHGKNLTPEQDLRIAEDEFAAGNLVHAAYHAGCALSADPTRSEFLAALDKISDVAPEPLKLAPVEERNYFATMAIRGYLLHRLNRLEEGLDVLLQAVVVKPEVPYLRWAIQWVKEPGAAGRIESGATRFLLELVNGKLAEWQQADPPLATIDLLPAFLQAIANSGTRDERLLFLTAAVLRRAGDPEAAYHVARRSYELFPGWHPAVAMGNALREMGKPDEAYASFQRALEHAPGELSLHLDMGDMMWEQRNWDAALHHYGAVLQKEPQHPWALPSHHAAQFRKAGEERWKASVTALARQGNERAQRLEWELGMDLETYLPERTEAAINVAIQVMERFTSPAEVPEKIECTISALEPASALMAVRYEMHAAGFPHAPSFKIEKVGAPDPRLPYGPVDYVAWRYEGMNPVPGYPPPAPDVLTTVSRIATQPYALPTWAQWGRRLAQESGVSVEPLVGAMVHPPAAPAGTKAWDWITRFQVAAAFVIAGRESGWSHTERRRVLLSLARGPMDWTVDAALLALAAIARETPEAVPEIADLHLDRYRGMPDHGACTYLPTLALCALDRPGLPDAERAHWEDVLQHVKNG